jgi:hypothetical protein
VTSFRRSGLGDAADPERPSAARRDVLALYQREGFFRAEVAVETRTDPATNGLAVTIDIDAGERARVGAVNVEGAGPLASRVSARARGVRPGEAYRESRVREAVVRVEERLRAAGFVGARSRRPLHGGCGVQQRHAAPSVAGTPAHPSSRAIRRSVTPSCASAHRLAGGLDEGEIAPVLREVEAAYREAGYPRSAPPADPARRTEITVRVTRSMGTGRRGIGGAAGVPTSEPSAPRPARHSPEDFRKGAFVEETPIATQALTAPCAPAAIRRRGWAPPPSPSDDGG